MNDIRLSYIISCCNVKQAAKQSDPNLDENKIAYLLYIEQKGIEELCKMYPQPHAADTIINALHADTEEQKAMIRDVLTEIFMDKDKADEIMQEVAESKNSNIISDNGIYALYHSNDPEWKKAAGDLALYKYRLFIHKYIHKHYGTYGPEYYYDYFNRCVEGIMESLKSYTPEKGSFMTYTKMWIKHHCSLQSLSMHNEQTPHYGKLQSQITEAIKKLMAEGHKPTAENIAIETELSIGVVKTELSYLQKTNFVFFDDPNQTKDLSDHYENSPEHIAEVRYDQETVHQALGKLKPLTRKILIARYVDEESNEDIAEELGISVKKVKDLTMKGLALMGEDSTLRKRLGKSVSIRNTRTEVVKTEMPQETNAEKQLDEVMGLVNKGLSGFTDSIYGDDDFSDGPEDE